jgi:hypothetical protein
MNSLKLLYFFKRVYTVLYYSKYLTYVLTFGILILLNLHCCVEKSRTLQKSSNQVFEYFLLSKCGF